MLEMIDRYPGLLGLMITRTPPVLPAQLGEGFKPNPHMGPAGQEVFSSEDVENFARSTAGEPIGPFMLDTVARTDGCARRMIFEKLAMGIGRDQNALVAGKTPPIAVLNGLDELFVNTDFVEAVVFSNLWKGKKHALDKWGHALSWDSPNQFDPIFEHFVVDMGKA